MRRRLQWPSAHVTDFSVAEPEETVSSMPRWSYTHICVYHCCTRHVGFSSLTDCDGLQALSLVSLEQAVHTESCASVKIGSDVGVVGVSTADVNSGEQLAAVDIDRLAVAVDQHPYVVAEWDRGAQDTRSRPMPTA
jgi:hypothetical protein